MYQFYIAINAVKQISDPSVFKATNNTVQIRLNNSDRFLYMQHISDHHLSIYLISSCDGVESDINRYANYKLGSM